MSQRELYLEGAKAAQTVDTSRHFFSVSIIYGDGSAPTSVAWSRLREKPFRSNEEASHWLHANAEKLLRERVLAVRLLEVVERRVPQLIAMFHEATPAEIKAALPKKEKKGATPQFGDLPGDEWKRADNDAEDDE